MRNRFQALALMGTLLAACQATPVFADDPPELPAYAEVPVINFTLQVEEEDFLREIAALEMDVSRKLAMTMDQVGWETVTFLRSLTNETSPPARPGEPSRRAHPGHWADITSNLANAYRFELYANGQLIRWSTEGPSPSLGGFVPSQISFPIELKFLNGMEYAAALEARDGYWVLQEITGQGGPVARAIRTVLARIAPEAKLA